MAPERNIHLNNARLGVSLNFLVKFTTCPLRTAPQKYMDFPAPYTAAFFPWSIPNHRNHWASCFHS